MPNRAKPDVCCWLSLKRGPGVATSNGLMTAQVVCRMGGIRSKKIALGQTKGHVGTFASANIGASQLQGYLLFCGRSHSSKNCIGLQTSLITGTQ